MVDLRDNPFDCKGFLDKTIFGVITDCEIAVTKTTIITHWNVHNYLYDCFVFIRFINAGHYPLFERRCKTMQNKTSYQNTSDFL